MRASPSSASTWRQAPQGDPGGRVGVTTATARTARAPAATAAATALRSAQGADREARVGRMRVAARRPRGRQQLGIGGVAAHGKPATIPLTRRPMASAPAAAARVTSSWRSGSPVTPAA